MNTAALKTSMRAVGAIYRRDPKRSGLIAAATVAMLGVSVRVVFGGVARASARTNVGATDAGSEVLRRPGFSAPQNPGLRSTHSTGSGQASDTGVSGEDSRALTNWLNAERH